MTNNEKYLNELNKHKAIFTKDTPANVYMRLVFKVCEHAINNCNLADYEDVVDMARVSPVEMADIERASVIWLIQYSVKNNIKLPYFCYSHSVSVLQNVAAGWIRKNVEANGDYRTTILSHPICNNTEKLWRFYDTANIAFMDNTGVPMVLLNDRELPLTAIHGFQKTYCTANTLDEYVDSTLFTFKGNDTDAMVERKMKLVLALTYFTFLLYPHASLKWFEEGRGILAFPYNILADALIVANHAMKLNGGKSMTEITENINDYTDEYIDTIIKLAEANTVADDDLMTRFNRVQEYLHSFHDAIWETVKEVEIIKNENK